jgi:hypothetical protein
LPEKLTSGFQNSDGLQQRCPNHPDGDDEQRQNDNAKDKVHGKSPKKVQLRMNSPQRALIARSGIEK